MFKACETYKGTSRETLDGKFSVKLVGHDRPTGTPRFIVTDKREAKHVKYSVESGMENWGITDTKTGVWNILQDADDDWRKFPMIDLFFGLEGTEIQDIGELFFNDIYGNMVDQLREKLGSRSGMMLDGLDSPPFEAMCSIRDLLEKKIGMADDEREYWLKLLRYGLENLPPVLIDEARGLYSTAGYRE